MLSKDIIDELSRSQPDTAMAFALSEKIGRKQAAFERTLYYHFQDLKQICGPEQQKKLRGLLYDLLGGPKPSRPPPRPGEIHNHPPPPTPRGNHEQKPPIGG